MRKETELKLKRLALIVAIPACIVSAIWYGLPEAVRPTLVDLNRRSAGLQERSIQVGTHHIRYLEGGRGPAVVLLHGIFAEKDHWVDFARALGGHYRIIVPDLPGYGGSTRLEDEPYDYAVQTGRLAALLDALDVERVHLAGSSMGGTLAALLALQQPQRVDSVAFIGAPHGIRSPQPSSMDREIDAGRAPLVAHDAAAFERMMALLFERPPLLPYPILQHAQAQAIERAPSNRRLWNEQLRNRYLLHERIGALQAPLLVLWGEQDRVFDASAADTLRGLLPPAQVDLLPGLGHLPMMEAPAETARRYAAFVQAQAPR
jgi:pimeloyl-ACP methyl ester carboxylesterase